MIEQLGLVVISSRKSSGRQVTCGASQGLVVASELFNIFVNNVDIRTECTLS